MKTFNFAALIRSAARRIWMWSPSRKEAIRLARVPGLKPLHVYCAGCQIKMRESPINGQRKDYAVDHIVPASEPVALIRDWNDYFKRLDVPAKGLQILCNSCHDRKTKQENELRKKPKYSKRRKSIR